MWSGTVTSDIFRREYNTTEQQTSDRRYLALWFPFLPTDRLRREHMSLFAGQAEKPLVLVEKAKGALRLVACDAHALQLGLSPGLMLADAQARVPNCTVAATDPDADQSFLMRLAEFCDRFTPMVALNTAQGLMLDITGCAHLFGGESRLHWLVSSHMARLGLALKASIASTPDAAHALARFGNCDICPSSEVEAAVRSLSVAALDLPQESAMALSRAGLKRLGDLADRPSVALTARFGEGLMVKLRRTLGWENARITPLRLLPR